MFTMRLVRFSHLNFIIKPRLRWNKVCSWKTPQNHTAHRHSSTQSLTDTPASGACRRPAMKSSMWMAGGLAHLQCVGVSQVGRTPVLCSLIHLFLPQPTQSDTHTQAHTHISGTPLATRTINSHNVINLKQTNIHRHYMMATVQMILINISKSISSWR